MFSASVPKLMLLRAASPANSVASPANSASGAADARGQNNAREVDACASGASAGGATETADAAQDELTDAAQDGLTDAAQLRKAKSKRSSRVNVSVQVCSAVCSHSLCILARIL
jgi:hypothetical protein